MLPFSAVVASGLVGESLCRRKTSIDPFGDGILKCSDLPGESWRQRHDMVKQAIVSECLASRPL